MPKLRELDVHDIFTSLDAANHLAKALLDTLKETGQVSIPSKEVVVDGKFYGAVFNLRTGEGAEIRVMFDDGGKHYPHSRIEHD